MNKKLEVAINKSLKEKYQEGLIMGKALGFAEAAHRGQTRKYTGVPYVTHPTNVAGSLRNWGCSKVMIAAGYLHDVLEDTPVTPEELSGFFGTTIADLVMEVTNPSKKHPELARSLRKEMDRKHLSQVSKEAKIIKMADMLDNYSDMQHDKAEIEFVDLYADEGLLLLAVLKEADENLAKWVSDVIHELRAWNKARKEANRGNSGNGDGTE